MGKYKVLSASVEIDNSLDGERVYDIRASFRTENGVLRIVDGGNVQKEGVQLATFYKSRDGESNMTVTYYGDASSDSSVQCEVTSAIHAFLTETEEIAVAEAGEGN